MDKSREVQSSIQLTQEQKVRFETAGQKLDGLYYSRIQMTHLIADPAYQEIVKMGMGVIQPILDKLSQGVNFWFLPLRETIINNIDENFDIEPVEGDFSKSREWRVDYDQIYEGDRRAALLWGEKNGYKVTLPE